MISAEILWLEGGLVGLRQPIARQFQPCTQVHVSGPLGHRDATAYILRIESDAVLLVSPKFNGEPGSPLGWATGDVVLFDEMESP